MCFLVSTLAPKHMRVKMHQNNIIKQTNAAGIIKKRRCIKTFLSLLLKLVQSEKKQVQLRVFFTKTSRKSISVLSDNILQKHQISVHHKNMPI